MPYYLPEFSMKITTIAAAAALTLFSVHGAAFAAHPLITDDTGTQGKGKYQLEMTGGIGRDRESASGVTVRETSTEAAATVSGGLCDSLDLVATVPFAWTRTTENGVKTGSDAGISDVTVEAKWRFLEGETVSMAIKPGISFPSGDEKRGLGNGRVSYGANLITSVKLDLVNLHVNLAYARNDFGLDENRDAQRKNILHGSIAATAEVAKGVQLVADLGTESNCEKNSKTWASYVIGGVIWSVNDSLDLDLGIKGGLTRAETDIAGLAGVTYRF
jgi:hypothetical protein